MVETRSKKRKRQKIQRLISIASNVSSWPDVPARFESLNDDTLTTILQFVGNKSYRLFGGLNYHCKEVYLNTPGMTKETFLFGYGPLSAIIDRYKEKEYLVGNWKLRVALSTGVVCYNRRDVLEWALQVGKGVVCYNRRDVLDWALEEREKVLLKGICYVAVGEERFDILDEVWNNVEDWDEDKRDINGSVDYYAAHHGKLNVLKWFETKGVYIICKNSCAEAAGQNGQLHILQWLKEEKGLELECYFYDFAIWGSGHLNVMKWLREQEVPWSEYTFERAAEKGNLEILQWLHDEGCPWPDYYRVREDKVKPEILDWLRVNGYENRILARR